VKSSLLWLNCVAFFRFQNLFPGLKMATAVFITGGVALSTQTVDG